MIRFLLLLALSALGGCKPARSDVFVEKVSAELVEKLLAEADSVLALKPDSSQPGENPLWVKGLRVYPKKPAKQTVLWYDEAGRVTGLMEYDNNMLTDSILFFQNGQRMLSVNINKQGQASGAARFYYPNGRVHEDGRFENGKRSGIWREFDPAGKLLATHEYDKYGAKVR